MITKFLVRKSQADHMFRRALFAVCLCASAAVMAAPIDKELQFNEGYVSSVKKTPTRLVPAAPSWFANRCVDSPPLFRRPGDW